MFLKSGIAMNLDRRGLTLVEMMISLAIFGVVMGVVFGFMTGTRDSYDQTRSKVQYQQAVRATVSLMTNEIRSTGCDPTNAGFDRFAVADDLTFRCRADLNGDGDATDVGPDEDVVYVFDSGAGTLTRDNGNGEGPLVILRNLTNFSFIYRDADGNVLGSTPLNALDRASIRYVQILILGETEDGQTIDYMTSAMVRNG